MECDPIHGSSMKLNQTINTDEKPTDSLTTFYNAALVAEPVYPFP